MITLLLLMCKIISATLNVQNLTQPSSYLDPKSYRKPNRCDFSEFVRKFKPEELEINCGNIHEVNIGKLLGSGNIRKVYEGEFHGRKVAIKKLRRDKYNNDRAINTITLRITHAAAVLFQLRGASNIAHLVGWCDNTIVVDKAAGGTLDELIFNKEQEISVKSALEKALDVAKGLQQLHTVPMGPVRHGDIQITQYLLSSQGTVLLGDFDNVVYNGYSNSNTKCPITIRADDDIYRIALIMWMLRARKRPYIHWWKIDEIRPDVENMSDYPQAMQDLIVEAWDEDRSKRPSATEMVQRIESILRDYNSLSID